MKYQVIEKLPDKLVVKIDMEGAEVEELATKFASQLTSVAAQQAGIRSNASLLASLPQFELVMKLALNEGVSSIQKELCNQENVVFLDSPTIQLLDGDFTGSFETMATIPLAEGLTCIDKDNLEVAYHPVVKAGDEVEKRIQEACEQYAVATPEELIEKTKLYESVEHMQQALELSLDAFVKKMNAKALRDGACQALVRANEFAVPAGMLSGYVDREIARIECHLGKGALAEQLASIGRSEADFRQEVAEKAVDALRLEILLDAVAVNLPLAVSDEERISKIDEQSQQNSHSIQDETAEEVLRAIKTQPSYLQSLDQSVRRDRALEKVVSGCTPKLLSPMTLDEFIRFQQSVMPLQ